MVISIVMLNYQGVDLSMFSSEFSDYLADKLM